MKIPHLSPLTWGVLLIGIAIHLLSFFYFKIKTLPRPHEQKPITPRFLAYPEADRTDSHQLIAEQGLLFDTTPVFLPTQWNYKGQQGESQMSKMFTQIEKENPPFDTFGPSITLKEIDLMEVVGLPDPRPSRPSDLLEREYWNSFAGFGASPDTIPLGERSSYFKIVDMQSGYVVGSITLTDAIDPSLDIPPLNPITFLIYVDKWGLVGSPLLLNTSGSDNLDLTLRKFTASEVFSQTVLKPGYYKVLIGP